jgi:hypothetical protein
MSKKPARPDQIHRPASRDDFHRILGELEDPGVIEVLALNPSVQDLEEAAICMAGDHDILAKSGHHVSSTASRIVEILTAADEEELPRPAQ